MVVGYGGAGAAAAITAHDAGAAVVILEKMPAGGGNTRLSVGNFQSPLGMGALDHAEALSDGTTGRETLRTYVAQAMHNKAWIESLGGETERAIVMDISYPIVPSVWWPNVSGAAEAVAFKVVHAEHDFPGEPLWRLLSENVSRRGITVLTDTPARELMTNQSGEVSGVVAERAGERISLTAKRAAVLTCGGFEFNEAMRVDYLTFPHLHPVGSPGNTGDGITMAEKVGAGLWHMTSVSGYPVFRAPEYEAAFGIRMIGGKFIYVNRDGHRFADETGLDFHAAWRAFAVHDQAANRYPNLPAYAVFDEVTRQRGPLYSRFSGYNRDYRWSLDNSGEVAKGWIKKGKTMAELARRIGVPEAALAGTVTRYNEFAASTEDPEFGRSRETLEPVDVAPYYAIEILPGLLNTHGGPRRDREARVLDTRGKPIPRLYAAGELGSIWGGIPEGSGNNAECFAFGRIAGRNAAAERPWG